MNLGAQLWRYLTKVYDLPRRLRAVRDTRVYPEISTPSVSAVLFLGALLRLPSFRQMAKDSARAGWRRLLKLAAPLRDDLMAYVVERYRLEDWREILVSTNKTLKRNRALESAKINGLLVVSIDANEQFNSRHRCCEACCRRKVKVRNRAGLEVEVDEFYHRRVYAFTQGPQFGVVLDVEPIRPGEDEAAAALRMLGRMRRLYGPRFFDVVTVDAWYTKTPFIRAVRRLGWGVVSVLKQERFNAHPGHPGRRKLESSPIGRRTQGAHAHEVPLALDRLPGTRPVSPKGRLADRPPALGHRKPRFQRTDSALPPRTLSASPPGSDYRLAAHSRARL